MIEKVGHRKFYSRALEIFMEEYRKNTERKGEFTVALSGGNTPKPLFRLLAKERIDWEKIHIFMWMRDISHWIIQKATMVIFTGSC